MEFFVLLGGAKGSQVVINRGSKFQTFGECQTKPLTQGTYAISEGVDSETGLNAIAGGGDSWRAGR